MNEEPSGLKETVMLGSRRTTVPPRVIGGYHVVRVLGEGGMGEVLLGRDPELNRPVAIKLIRKELVGNSFFVDRFQREARLSAALNHPNIVTTYAVGKEDDLPFLVLEYVDGRTLRDLLRTPPPLPLARILDIFRQCCEGLEAAAQRSIVHRDFKPANVMVRDADGLVKLMDFGLSREITGETLTMTSAVMGTPDYMSPEQATGRRVDYRTDIYAMGISLFQCATGYLPFSNTSAFETMKAHLEDPLPDDARLKKIAGGELDALIRRMTAKRPEDRPESYTEIRQDLGRIRGRIEKSSDPQVSIAAEPAVQVASPEPPRKAKQATPARAPKAKKGTAASAPRRRIPVAVVFAVLALLIAAVGGGTAWKAGLLSPPSPASASVPEPAPPGNVVRQVPTQPPAARGTWDFTTTSGTASELLHALGMSGLSMTASGLEAERIPVAASFQNRRPEDVLAVLSNAFGWQIEVSETGITRIGPGEAVLPPARGPLPEMALNTMRQRLTVRQFAGVLSRNTKCDYLIAGHGLADAGLGSFSTSTAPLDVLMDEFVSQAAPMQWTFIDNTLIIIPAGG